MENSEKQFKIVYVNRKRETVILYVEGSSAIVEENNFKKRHHDDIHLFHGIEFQKYITNNSK